MASLVYRTAQKQNIKEKLKTKTDYWWLRASDSEETVARCRRKSVNEP